MYPLKYRNMRINFSRSFNIVGTIHDNTKTENIRRPIDLTHDIKSQPAALFVRAHRLSGGLVDLRFSCELPGPKGFPLDYCLSLRERRSPTRRVRREGGYVPTPRRDARVGEWEDRGRYERQIGVSHLAFDILLKQRRACMEIGKQSQYINKHDCH